MKTYFTLRQCCTMAPRVEIADERPSEDWDGPFACPTWSAAQIEAERLRLAIKTSNDIFRWRQANMLAIALEFTVAPQGSFAPACETSQDD